MCCDGDNAKVDIFSGRQVFERPVKVAVVSPRSRYNRDLPLHNSTRPWGHTPPGSHASSVTYDLNSFKSTPLGVYSGTRRQTRCTSASTLRERDSASSSAIL